jgi:hypothetical protein
MTRIRLAAVTGVLAAALAVAPTAGSQPRQATFGNLIAALNNINVQINRLNVLSNITAGDVRVVNVENVLGSASRWSRQSCRGMSTQQRQRCTRAINIRVLNNVLNRNNVKILNLRNFLNNVLNNPTCSVVALCNVLNNANIVVTDVIAINVLSGGDVIIFRDGPGLPNLP